jgi:iron complex transport system ATP-binding protein
VSSVYVRSLVVELGGRRILDEVDLDVAPGSWVSIVGPNGAGKTTLVRALAGMVKPVRGAVAIAGVPAHAMRARARARSLAVVPQAPVIPAGVSVFDYALLGRTPYVPYFGRESEQDVEACRAMLARLGVAELASRPVETLSGGERQRVVLSRALLQGAPIVVLDEPTTGQDHRTTDRIAGVIRDLRAAGTAVVVVSHDMALVAAIADRLVVLDAGRIVAHGTPRDVLTDTRLAATTRLAPPQITQLAMALPGPTGRRVAMSVPELVAQLRDVR